jgi:ATP-dependent helicase HrpB
VTDYQPLGRPSGLPIDDVLPDLHRALDAQLSAVLVAPPGAGKTTIAPLSLLAAPWLGDQRIVMLEPRRLATRAAAQRMAALAGSTVGDLVGYQTRDERRLSAQTRIEVVTEGVLTRRLQNDPTLPHVGLVIFDEVHERNLPTDLGLALTLDCRSHLRPDLRVLAMSATPHVEPLRRLLSECPVVESDGRTHPVDIVWAPPPKGQRLEQSVPTVVMRALRDNDGDVLVFLPGIGEIRRVQQQLATAVPDGVDLFPLAGALSLAEHDAALAPSPPGRRRVVLATDIAESSLTVSGVRVVVDAGLARTPRFDVRTGMTKLTTVAASRASTEQRAGRAGRTEPGTCYRLWSKLEQATRSAHLPAEITQVDLCGLALELAMWGSPVKDLAFLDSPPAKAMAQARDVLQRLGALDEAGTATELGRSINRLPLHPRLGKMVVGAAVHGLLSTAAVIAALADDRDVFRGPPDSVPADVALRVAAISGQHPHDLADRRDLRRVADRAADIAHRAGATFDTATVQPDRSGFLLGMAFPDRLAYRRSQRGQFQLRGGQGAFTSATDTLADEDFLIVADLDGNRSGARIRLAAALDASEVMQLFAADVVLDDRLSWDRDRNDLVVRSTIRLGSMTLDERVGPPDASPETTAALVERVRSTRFGVLPTWADSEQLRARVELVRSRHRNTWPDLGDGALLRSLDDWLAPFLGSACTRADLEQVDITLALSSMLDWDQHTTLTALAPPSLSTPAGRNVAIDYTRPNPTAAVRVQDMFGVSVHPTVLGGEIPITLELLSPADRPIQTTADLPGFWAGTWTEVRKEMAGRYPKHQWPADPAHASPKRLKER